MASRADRVPVRAILATIGLVVATVLLFLLVRATALVLTWMVIAAVVAIALYPVVNWVEARAGWIRRSIATLLVYLVVIAVLGGLVTLFVVPLVQQVPQLADKVPEFLQQAREGSGPAGPFLRRFNLDEYLRNNQEQFNAYITNLGGPVLALMRSIANTLIAVLTIFVLSYLMVLMAPRIIDAVLAAVPDEQEGRVRRIGADCAKVITGYLSGNVVISVIAGVSTYIVLILLDVPFAALIALFVAVTDLIPLVGATMGAVVAIAASLVQSVTAAVIVGIFMILYQQVENHLLQPVIMARTVNLNPLTVLIAVLFGVALAGVIGALLAIPVAGVLQVILREVWDVRRGQLKPLPPEPAPDPEPAPLGVEEKDRNNTGELRVSSP